MTTETTASLTQAGLALAEASALTAKAILDCRGHERENAAKAILNIHEACRLVRKAAGGQFVELKPGDLAHLIPSED